MTPALLFRYCFAVVTGTGAGILVVMTIFAALAAIAGISAAVVEVIEKKD